MATKKLPVIPCNLNDDLKRRINELADTLMTDAHLLGAHGLTEDEFYRDGLFRGAIERVRGQFSATMRDKREFIKHILDYMQDEGFIKAWESSGGQNRHDYNVTMLDDRIAVIEAKGCLDGNNTNIFERPVHANEFIIWSICNNAGADPRLNVWSGIHTRLGCEIIQNEKLVDGLVVWDWICGTVGRPCPKLTSAADRQTVVGQYKLAPPCIYLFPATIPSVRNNPNPSPHSIGSVSFLKALHECFGGRDEELNYVQFTVAHSGREVVRSTRIERGGVVQRQSKEVPIRRR